MNSILCLSPNLYFNNKEKQLLIKIVRSIFLVRITKFKIYNKTKLDSSTDQQLGLSSLLLKLNVKSKQFKETNKKMMSKWKVIIMKKMILSILTKTLLKIIHKIWVNKFRLKIMFKIKEHITIITVIMIKKTTMMKITLKRLMRFKNIDKNKIKSQFNNFRKFKRTIVLMGKSSKKAIIKTSMTIVMKRVKMMMKNFINIISLNKKSQTSVIWTRIIRKKLL